MTGQSALVFGATGAVGKEILKELLASPDVVRVGEYGRRSVTCSRPLLLLIVCILRVTPLDNIGVGKDKLEQKTIDFKKLEESGLKEGKWDVVYVACVAVLIHFLQPAQAYAVFPELRRLGTSKSAAGSAAAFEKIDREFVHLPFHAIHTN